MRPAIAARAGFSSSAFFGRILSGEANLTPSAALRLEDYSDFGRATALKLSGRYVLASSLSLRGTLSSGFRAGDLQGRPRAAKGATLLFPSL